ncbi:MAG: hypothetical protein ABUL60_25690 [Myxococcales bacterium]
MRCSRPFAAALAFSVLGLTGAASAQTKDTDYSYHFEDDLMVGDTFASPPPPIIVRRTSPRIMFLRPRANFVAELLKSVESL